MSDTITKLIANPYGFKRKRKTGEQKMAHKTTDQIELAIDDIMPFGKYAEHYTVRAVLADDPGYLRWIADTSYNYCLSDEVEEALENAALRMELIDDANF